MDVARIGVHRRRYCKANAARSQEVCENGLGLAQSHEQSRRSGVRRLVLLDRATSQQLPSLFGELEKCQKSLEGYLEQKRKSSRAFASFPTRCCCSFCFEDPTQQQSSSTTRKSLTVSSTLSTNVPCQRQQIRNRLLLQLPQQIQAQSAISLKSSRWCVGGQR